MWHHYWLQPTVAAERVPVLLLVHVALATRDGLDLRLYIAGARTLSSIPGLTPDGIRCVMQAGTTWNRFEGVRLSNGFNVVDPEDWRGQGIGSVALNAMVAWAKQYHPAADVRPIALTRHHRRDIAADDPRLRFYRRFGLDWAAEDQMAGAPDWLSQPMTVEQLHGAPLPPHICSIAAPQSWNAR